MVARCECLEWLLRSKRKRVKDALGTLAIMSVYLDRNAFHVLSYQVSFPEPHSVYYLYSSLPRCRWVFIWNGKLFLFHCCLRSDSKFFRHVTGDPWTLLSHLSNHSRVGGKRNYNLDPDEREK